MVSWENRTVSVPSGDFATFWKQLRKRQLLWRRVRFSSEVRTEAWSRRNRRAVARAAGMLPKSRLLARGLSEGGLVVSSYRGGDGGRVFHVPRLEAARAPPVAGPSLATPRSPAARDSRPHQPVSPATPALVLETLERGLLTDR